MRIKALLINILGEPGYLSFLAGAFQRLYPTGKLGLIYQDVYFLRHIVGKGDVCVDIGAHLGYYTLEMSRRAGAAGKIIAIEPMPAFNQVLGKLLRKRKAGNVELLQVALGGDGEYVEMGIPKVGNSKQFAYARVMASDAQYEYLEQVKVKNERGDDLFSQMSRLDFIKCDVEGLEIKVFSSMMETLSRHRPILLVELVDKGERIKFFDLLRPLGYAPYFLEKGRLYPLDLYSDAFPVSHNHYFIPGERRDRLSDVMNSR
ncbi:MAG TPA: FkbM family methyltransferase [Puia sp.]|jgi:FkbM family methyltransferase